MENPEERDPTEYSGNGADDEDYLDWMTASQASTPIE